MLNYKAELGWYRFPTSMMSRHLHSIAKSRNGATTRTWAETRRIDQFADANQQQHSLWPLSSRSSAAYLSQVGNSALDSTTVLRGDDGS